MTDKTDLQHLAAVIGGTVADLHCNIAAAQTALAMGNVDLARQDMRDLLTTVDAATLLVNRWLANS